MVDIKQYFMTISAIASFCCLFIMMLMMGTLGSWTQDAMRRSESNMERYWEVLRENEDCTIAYEE